MSESYTWEKQEGESTRWYSRFSMYLHLGTNRSLLGTVHREEAERSGVKQSKKVPGSWDVASRQWEWKARAEAWDAWERKRIESQRQAYVDSILQEGYALVHERVKSLSEVANQLKGYLSESDKVFLPDVKQIGNGPLAERVDLVNFNDPLFEQYRKYLADIAAEMGGRVKVTKADVTANVTTDLSMQVVFKVPPKKRNAGESVTPDAPVDNDDA